jgi:hypothetical protein
MERLNVGNVVDCRDKSYSVAISGGPRFDGIPQRDSGRFNHTKFNILEILGESATEATAGNGVVHDVIIENNITGHRYLHSLRFLGLTKDAKEVTMADLAEKYGCEVKVIDG